MVPADDGACRRWCLPTMVRADDGACRRWCVPTMMQVANRGIVTE
jgi:hypothetical protein